MAGVITRSNHPDALWPGVLKWFGKSYGEYPKEWRELFESVDSTKAYEYLIEATSFGLASPKPEGSSVVFDSDQEGTKNTWTNVTYALGYIVTREEMEDDQYEYVSKRRSRSLAFSMRQTEEVVHANVLNRAFSGSYVGGDGVSLISAAHPTLSGNQSNLITAADFSEASLEDGLKQVARATNARGLKIAINATKLVVSVGDMFNAQRIVNSELRPGTANNDINATKAMGMLPQGIVVNHYLTDQDAWFLKTDVPEGLVSLRRREIEFDQDNDFDTENAKAKATQRYTPGWGDFRGIYGSEGTA